MYVYIYTNNAILSYPYNYFVFAEKLFKSASVVSQITSVYVRRMCGCILIFVFFKQCFVLYNFWEYERDFQVVHVVANQTFYETPSRQILHTSRHVVEQWILILK